VKCFNVGDSKYCAYCIHIGSRCEISKVNKARRGPDISTILSNGIRLSLQESPRQSEMIMYVRHTCRLFRRSYPSEFGQAIQAQADAHDITEDQLLAGLFPGDLPPAARPDTSNNAFVASFVPAGFIPGRLALTAGPESSSPAGPSSGGSQRRRKIRRDPDFSDGSDFELVTPAPTRGQKRKPDAFPMDVPRKKTLVTVEDEDDEDVDGELSKIA
jgi:hypothetical protein